MPWDIQSHQCAPWTSYEDACIWDTGWKSWSGNRFCLDNSSDSLYITYYLENRFSHIKHVFAWKIKMFFITCCYFFFLSINHPSLMWWNSLKLVFLFVSVVKSLGLFSVEVWAHREGFETIMSWFWNTWKNISEPLPLQDCLSWALRRNFGISVQSWRLTV